VGPFNTPWGTFAAWIVVGASVLISLVWAVFFARDKGSP
jgi:hypothetical protein